jgi:hypothetical protein
MACRRARRTTWALGLLLAGTAHARETPLDVPSLTPWTDADLAGTVAFTRRPPPDRADGPWLTLPLTPWTDAPDAWDAVRFGAVLRLTRWYLGACRIRVEAAPLRVLPRGLPKRHDGLFRTDADAETLVILTTRLDRTLLGYATRAKERRRPRRGLVFARRSVVLTVLPHELGHRLGLPHVTRPYALMIGGPKDVFASTHMAITSGLGFFDPRRFGFTADECATMRRRLEADLGRAYLMPRQAGPSMRHWLPSQ